MYAYGGLKLERVKKDEIKSETAIILNLAEGKVLIAGSDYGER